MMTLVVIDDSFEGRADLSTQNPAGMSVNIFKKDPNEFPAVKQIGDIVQFRHFRVKLQFVEILIFFSRFNIMNLIFRHYLRIGRHSQFSIEKVKMDLGPFPQNVKFIQKNLK